MMQEHVEMKIVCLLLAGFFLISCFRMEEVRKWMLRRCWRRTLLVSDHVYTFIPQLELLLRSCLLGITGTVPVVTLFIRLPAFTWSGCVFFFFCYIGVWLNNLLHDCHQLLGVCNHGDHNNKDCCCFLMRASKQHMDRC